MVDPNYCLPLPKLKSWLLVHTLLNLMSILTTRNPPISVLSTVCYLGKLLISHLLYRWSWGNFTVLPSLNAQRTTYTLWTTHRRHGLTPGTQKEDFVKKSERQSYRSDFGDCNGAQIFMEGWINVIKCWRG